MANRAVYGQQQVNKVAVKDTSYKADIAQSVADIAGMVVQTKAKQDQLKMTNYATEAEMEMIRITQEWRNLNSENPDDPQAYQKLEERYNKIFAQYEDKIGFGARGQWNIARDKIKQRYKKEHVNWQLAQNVTNAETNLNQSKANSLKMAYEYGVSGDNRNALTLMNEAREAISAGATGLLSETDINAELETFDSDFVKQYLQGIIQRDPAQAEELLNNPEMRKVIGSQEAEKALEDMVKKQYAQINLAQKKQELEWRTEFVKNQDSMSTGEQLSALDTALNKGEITPKYAKSARKAILSSKGIDSTTQVETYADYIVEKDMLLLDAGTQNITIGEYFDKITDLTDRLHEDVANGKVKAGDARQILLSVANSQDKVIKEGTEGKVAWLQWDAKKANQLFSSNLNSGNRSKALVEFFKGTYNDDYKQIEGVEIKNREDYAKYLLEKYRTDEVAERVNDTITLEMNGIRRSIQRWKYDRLSDEQKAQFEVVE